MSYKDIILMGMPSGEDIHSPPVLPNEYMREYLSCIPRIPLPNSQFLFYMRAQNNVIDALLSDHRIKNQIIANSWSELFFSNFEYWDWIFDLDVSERFGSQIYRVRRKLAYVTDQEIHGIYVPGVFAGDDVPELRIPQFVIEKYRRLKADIQIVTPALSLIEKSIIDQIRKNPHEIHNIRPRQFEELICDLLIKFGWDVELTPETKDGGFDIIGFSGSTGGIKTSWIIECKKYAPHRKVGVGVVRAICGVKEQKKVANAMIVTTSSFTSGAQQLSKSRWDLDLKDYNNIQDWLSINSD